MQTLRCFYQLIGLLAATLPGLAQSFQPTWVSIDSRSVPAWFEDAKFDIFHLLGRLFIPAYSPHRPRQCRRIRSLCGTLLASVG